MSFIDVSSRMIPDDGMVSGINIELAQKHYAGAVFLTSHAIPTKGGGWTDSPAAVFYQPVLLHPSHSHYFSLFRTPDMQVMITNAAFILDRPLSCAVADNEELVFSRYRHDFRTSTDGSVWIDGGRDYTRTSSNQIVLVSIRDGKFYTCDC